MSAINLSEVWEESFHESRIFAHFGGAVRYESTAPIFDHPLAVILFSNRSGSNLLAERLVDTGHFSGFDECLNFDFVINVSAKHSIATFPNFFADIARDNIRHGAIFGIKASVGQFAMLMRWGISKMFREVKIINIERNDIVEQAVSMSIAEQTASWSSEIKSTIEPEYRYDKIEEYLGLFTTQLAARRVALNLVDMPSLTFLYHELVTNPSSVINSCCDLFERPRPIALSSETRHKKQGGALNAEFASRFRAEVLQKVLSGQGTDK